MIFLVSAVLSVFLLLQSAALSQSQDLVRLPSASSFITLPQTGVSYSSTEDVGETTTGLIHDQNAFRHVVSTTIYSTS